MQPGRSLQESGACVNAYDGRKEHFSKMEISGPACISQQLSEFGHKNECFWCLVFLLR